MRKRPEVPGLRRSNGRSRERLCGAHCAVYRKPVIAAVNGLAMGGGFEIALACDLIIASENAIFALPEPRVGLAALAGGIHRLPREIGMKQAMGMLLTGRRVSASEGQQLGFVNEVVQEGEALASPIDGQNKY